MSQLETPPIADAVPQGAPDAAAPAAVIPEIKPVRVQGWSPSAAFWALQCSHAVIDVYPMFIAALAVTLNERLHMTSVQYAAMLAVGPVVSGLPQAFFAWASDRLDTRFCAWFGLALGAICLCSIGFVTEFWQLIVLQVIGLTGTGMFHPIGAALAGQLAHRVLRHGRSWGVSIFYSAGMLGSIVGPIMCTRMTDNWGMRSLAWLIPPSMLIAWGLYLATARVAHRVDGHRAIQRELAPADRRRRWNAVWLLFFANTMRFVVNTGMFVLFGYWAKARFPADTAMATNVTGNLCSAMAVGMMVCGLAGGRLIRPGHEKGPMIWLSLVGAVPVGLCALAGDHVGLWAMYLLTALSAVGFATIIPSTVSLAQRLLPGRTGLASGLMLGTSWSIASVAPWYASLMLGNIPLDDIASLPTWRLEAAFAGFGALLIVSAVLAVALPRELLRATAGEK